MISDEDIRTSIIDKNDVFDACEELIQKANNAGGTDNISVALIKL